MRASQAIDDALRPVKVFAPPLERPVRRRCKPDVPQVADLVRELYELGAQAQVLRVFDLQALALGLVERLVIGDLENHGGDFLAESAEELLGRRGGVLDRIVQQRGHDHRQIIDARLIHQNAGERDRMVDIGGRVSVLAPLVTVFRGGEGGRRDQD